MNGKIKIIFSTLIIFCSILSGASDARAVVTDTVGILPAYPSAEVKFSDAWFIYNLDLGQEKMDGVRLFNNKDETVVIKLYAVDATTTSDGSFALLPEDAPRNDIGGWIKLMLNEIEMPPRSQRIVPFKVSVPKNTDVGDHLGGIIMQEVDTASESLAGTGVKIISRVGVRIYQTVPGKVQKGFDITRFDWRTEPKSEKSYIKDFLDLNKKTSFFVGIKNTGNVRITPRATIEVKNIFGQTVARIQDSEIGVVFPRGENADGSVEWDGMPIIGRYTVKMTTTFFEDGVGQQSRDLVIWAFPYRIIFMIIFLAVVIMLLALIKRYFFEISKEKMPIYRVRPGDTLAVLSRKFSVPWHKIANVNEIKKPFEIQEGNRLFIPINKKNREALEKLLNSRELEPSISKRQGSAPFRGMRVGFVVFILAIIGGGAVYGIRARNNQVVHREVPVDTKEEEPKQETNDMTKAGAFKKSSVEIGIVTLPSGDTESSQRLVKKFELIGYRAVTMQAERNYAATTIEHKPGKGEHAEMVRTDLGISARVELIESSSIEKDVMIYNASNRNEFLEIVDMPQTDY